MRAIVKKFAAASLVLVLLSACGGNMNPPRNTENACAMLAERPEFARAMSNAERKWGVPMHVQMATIYQESSFRGDARTPRKHFLGLIPLGRVSSAYGYAQAVDGTWEEYQQKEGGRMARRTSIDDAADFIGWTMHNTSMSMGVSKYDARTQYLIYHEGRTGYRRGTHQNKSWLLNVAQRVQERANRYQAQLASCRR